MKPTNANTHLTSEERSIIETGIRNGSTKTAIVQPSHLLRDLIDKLRIDLSPARKLFLGFGKTDDGIEISVRLFQFSFMYCLAPCGAGGLPVRKLSSGA